MSSPWAKISAPEPINLIDIMSEEVARDLQDKENRKYQRVQNYEEQIEIPPELLPGEDNLTESDEAIAFALQKQFNKEYDDILKRSEDKQNGSSKVSVSYGNFRLAPTIADFESESEEEEYDDVENDSDRFDTALKEFGKLPPCGYKMSNGNIITKHDVTMNNIKNGCKLMSFPPEFETGDGAAYDLKLSNKVFNSLKIYSKNEEARRHKMNDKKDDHATSEFGVDTYTRLLLYKIINNNLIIEINGVISIGKEAVILHADTNPSYFETPGPKECVIKVFKTTLSEFKQRDKYIKDDYRFKDKIGNQTSRKTVGIWAEKEKQNLIRLQKAGIPCPEVVYLKEHVLIMSFIGEDHIAAPKLKDANLDKTDYIIAYEQIVNYMKILYSKAKLIHADLSEYNILWHKESCYIIDVAQSVEPQHENAYFFLMRDCENITKFFIKKGIPKVATAEELFKGITNYDYEEHMEHISLQESFKMKPHLVDKLNEEIIDHFENAWEKSQNDKLLSNNAETHNVPLP